jgi:hypothetical protein
MKKTISVKPVTEIELQFEDGNSLDIRFDAEAISNFSELDGGLTAFINEDKLPERCAKIIFVGARARRADFTLEEARAVVSTMAPTTITEIVFEFNESMGATSNGVQSELQKKLMAQYLEKIMK